MVESMHKHTPLRGIYEKVGADDMKKMKRVVVLALALLMISGCGAVPQGAPEELSAQILTLDTAEIVETAVPLAAAPAALPLNITPVASGTAVKKTDKAIIDYSNVVDGYVMVKYTASTTKALKAQVKGPSGVTYTYNISAGKWAVFSLSDGSGSYQVSVFENVSGSKYATVASVTFEAKLKNEFAPFLLPNQYVDYSNAPKTLAKAKELTAGTTDPLAKVKAVYNFVVTTLTYDQAKAAGVKSGYLPVLDRVLSEKKGICFDYAALMAAMLRSQDVPCKLVVGYAGKAYHAWINVYSEESGWIDAAIYFDGTNWNLMDPTFASSGKQSAAIMDFIGDGKNYTAKYIY